jgi:hypothetical protein
MATLMPSLSSDEEDNGKVQENETTSDDEVNEDFEFGGILVRRDLDSLPLISAFPSRIISSYSAGRRRWIF